MEGVQNRGGPRAAGEDGGHAPGRARLRGVGVQHVRAALAQDPAERPDGGRVAARRELALQRRQPEDRNRAGLRLVLHRVLAGGQRPGDDHRVVAPPALLRGELDHGEGGTAHVQPGDHVHDPQRRPRHGVTSADWTSAALAATTPMVSQKIAAIGVPPKSAAPASTPIRDAVHAAGR